MGKDPQGVEALLGFLLLTLYLATYPSHPGPQSPSTQDISFLQSHPPHAALSWT